MGREAHRKKQKAPRGAFWSSSFGRHPRTLLARLAQALTTVRTPEPRLEGARILPKVADKRYPSIAPLILSSTDGSSILVYTSYLDCGKIRPWPHLPQLPPATCK